MDSTAILEPRRILQVLALGASFGSLIVICYRYFLSQSCVRRVLITPILFLSHIFLYYTTVILSQEAIDMDRKLFGTDIQFHSWSTGVTIHAIVTVMFLTYAYMKQHKLKEELEQWNILHKSLRF